MLPARNRSEGRRVATRAIHEMHCREILNMFHATCAAALG
jgi:hypothetical protein